MSNRWVMLGGAVIVAGAVIAGWMLAGRGDATAPRRFDLGNGFEFEAVAVTTGSNHLLRVGRWPWLNPARQRWEVVRGLLGRPAFPARNGAVTNGLCLFLRGPEGRWPAFKGPRVLAVLDAHGCTLPHFDGADSDSGQGEDRVHSLGFRVHPRRQSGFDVELAGGIGPTSAPPRRIRVTNPSPWRGDEWRPEPLPAVRVVAGVRFVFLGFDEEGPVPRVRLRVESGGRERKEWELRDLVYTDVTGNRSPDPVLCRREPAWRIEAAYALNPASAEGSEGAREFEGVTWPGPGELRILECPQGMSAEGIEAVMIGGPGNYRLRPLSSGKWESEWADPGLDAPWSTFIQHGFGTPWATVNSRVPWAAVLKAGFGPDDAVGLAWRPEGEGWRAVTEWMPWLAERGMYHFEPRGISPGDRGRLRWVFGKVTRVAFMVAPPAGGIAEVAR